MRIILGLLLISIFLSCQNETKSTSNKPEVKEKESVQKSLEEDIKRDSIRIAKLKKEEAELQQLKDKGAIGKWKCNFTGYESIIILYKQNGQYFAEVDFTESNMRTKTETLNKRGDKYYVKGSKAKEYYRIRENNNLEMGDKEGLFTNAINIMPGQDQAEPPKLDLKKVIGQNIFTVAGNYSESYPKTMDGTNSNVWKVFYEDINVVFTVDKSTKKILSAKRKD